jgi:hypothetical protein
MLFHQTLQLQQQALTNRDSIFRIGTTDVELFSSVGLYYGDKIAYLISMKIQISKK